MATALSALLDWPTGAVILWTPALCALAAAALLRGLGLRVADEDAASGAH